MRVFLHDYIIAQKNPFCKGVCAGSNIVTFEVYVAYPGTPDEALRSIHQRICTIFFSVILSLIYVSSHYY
tara:strand:+ start:1523 stop:1732 length:210 start_codon:yes stop_codon:yes gene_type:complete